MNKFLAVFDGYKMSESTLQYAIRLAQDARAHLTGVFLDDLLYQTYNVYDVVIHHKNNEALTKELDDADKAKRDEAARYFQSACEKARVPFSIHRDKNVALQELKKESLFADLVIINEHETFSNEQELSPTRFVKDLLADVHCPVLVVPDTFKPIEKIVLLYNGDPSSLYAIKMYCYLLGCARQLPVEILTVKEEVIPVLRLPENKLMRDFVKRHFGDAQYTIVHGESEEKVISLLKQYGENELVVLGAYGRSVFSRWFKTSLGDVLLQELNLPLFIAHEK